MIILLATSKTMNFSDRSFSDSACITPVFKRETETLSEYLKRLSLDEIQDLMKISHKLAIETKSGIDAFSNGTDPERQKPAIFTFSGEVFKGIDPHSFTNEDLEYCNKSLRILSGLYGILSPLTGIEPYRLEMGYRLDIEGFKKVSHFWREKVTSEINRLAGISRGDVVDLASKEYTDSIDKKKLCCNLVGVEFKENKNGKLKTIPVYSKKARGKMAGYIIRNRIEDICDIAKFKEDGYKFMDKLSNQNNLVFSRSS